MEDFTFRARFKLAKTCSINIEASSIQVTVPGTEKLLLLSSHEYEKTISKAHDLVLESRGWSSNQEALTAGEQYRDALMVAFACLRIGADFGNRSPKSWK
ncbi:hypothetical protein NIES2119_07535 [[Phormidium ambiguum] IAM M-71]|uniref:Uncharacterized protein n=1 Tax=[Phormidium ambiguum] IAM M-71 TaxID=454136 RepID=A0A1U7INW6_9CYAN|nr:hypothetical protein [Phormidium ambiguum]OKH38985.1 hypothetical protein NIES2119_07535 [Phormidium ambiguum IAM M-71]